MSLTTSAGRFAQLHHGERPLLLPNAWDHASGAALVAAGFPAIGTTSLGVAAAAGLPDGEGRTRDETVRLARVLSGLPCLLTVDIEAGFGHEPADVAVLAGELARLGVAGVNIEDNLGDVGRQRELIAALAGSGLFVNARTDTHWLAPAGTDLDREALSRAMSYVDAGAHGVFVPGLTDEKVISELVPSAGVPVNILYSATGPSYQRLGELGVGRVSCGSLLFRVGLDAAVHAAEAIAQGQPVPRDVVGYSEVVRRSNAAHKPDEPSRGNRP